MKYATHVLRNVLKAFQKLRKHEKVLRILSYTKMKIKWNDNSNYLTFVV